MQFVLVNIYFKFFHSYAPFFKYIMFDDPHKLNVPGKGFKRIVPKEQKEETDSKKYFDPDAQKNWLFKDDPEYTKKRKKRGKYKKKNKN